jgi:hypothetical protein
MWWFACLGVLLGLGVLCFWPRTGGATTCELEGDPGERLLLGLLGKIWAFEGDRKTVVLHCDGTRGWCAVATSGRIEMMSVQVTAVTWLGDVWIETVHGSGRVDRCHAKFDRSFRQLVVDRLFSPDSPGETWPETPFALEEVEERDVQGGGTAELWEAIVETKREGSGPRGG